ncbi:MAG TPA: hypothetical protein VFC05_08705 [Nitrososphaeraceae archaeon]|nr:hypothetical protein [Nitrososphaeraceae archaeon]
MAFKDELTITPRAFKFTAKLFEFSLKDASEFFARKNSEPNIDDKMKTGFANFLECLELCLQQYDYDITTADKVTIYGSVTLENGVIMRATNSFYNRSWFSNISVCMNSEELFEYLSDEGHICYG